MIGIVGGMGPEAGLMLFDSILSHTKASTDQEHASVVMMSYPSRIVDRTAFLEGKVSANPAYGVARIVRDLEKAGASVIGIACNTIYAPRIFDVLVEELDRAMCKARLLHMPLETCNYMRSNYPGVKRVGIMSTNGTYKFGQYRNLLSGQGYEVIVPDPVFQNDVIHRMIYDRQYGMKANPNHMTREAVRLMKRAIRFFKARQAEVILLGCTELSIMLTGKKQVDGMGIVSSVEAMALALIREAAADKVAGEGILLERES